MPAKVHTIKKGTPHQLSMCQQCGKSPFERMRIRAEGRGEHFRDGGWAPWPPPARGVSVTCAPSAPFRDKGEISKVHDVIENHFAECRRGRNKLVAALERNSYDLDIAPSPVGWCRAAPKYQLVRAGSNEDMEVPKLEWCSP